MRNADILVGVCLLPDATSTTGNHPDLGVFGMDFVVLAIAVGFFVLMSGFVRACAKL